MPSINIALIGCGAVSQQFYAPSLAYLSERSRLRVTAIVDPHQPSIDALAEKFPDARSVASQSEIDPKKVDLAIIASPPKFHCSQTIDSLDNGWHVLCEKPMAYSASEADQMIQAAEKNKRLLAVGHYKRFFPAAQEIKHIIEEEIFGSLLSYEIQEGGKFGWPAASDSFFRKEITPGGILLDIGVHVLDLIIWWLGNPDSFAYKDDALGGLEANARLELSHSSGAKGDVFLTREWNTPMAYTFHFEKATVVYRVNDSNGLSIRLKGSQRHLSGTLRSYRQYGNQELPEAPLDTNASSFIRQLDNVISSIQGDAQLLVDGVSGRAPLALIEACYNKRTTIDMPWLTAEEQAAAKTKQDSRHTPAQPKAASPTLD